MCRPTEWIHTVVSVRQGPSWAAPLTGNHEARLHQDGWDSSAGFCAARRPRPWGVAPSDSAGQDSRLLRLEFVVGQHAGVAELTELPGAGQFDLGAALLE